MAHHWSEPENNQMSGDEFKKLFKKGDEPGATGKFPDGKIDALDEGEIQLRIGEVEGRIVIEFGKPISTIGFTKIQAIEIGTILIKRASDLNQ